MWLSNRDLYSWRRSRHLHFAVAFFLCGNEQFKKPADTDLPLSRQREGIFFGAPIHEQIQARWGFKTLRPCHNLSYPNVTIRKIRYCVFYTRKTHTRKENLAFGNNVRIKPLPRMAKERLDLTVQPKFKKLARQLAKKRRRSISALFEDLVEEEIIRVRAGFMPKDEGTVLSRSFEHMRAGKAV